MKNLTKKKLEFTPLEFETVMKYIQKTFINLLEFTPLEFETYHNAPPY